MFEIVYTVTDWYDGPRRGIANYQGKPHLFESEWRDGENLDADTFLLVPIEPEVFALALEDWRIWRRWEAAFHQGKTLQETHPALPEDRNRHEQLINLLEGRLIVDMTKAMRRKAEFRASNGPEWSGYGTRHTEVRWEPFS